MNFKGLNCRCWFCGVVDLILARFTAGFFVAGR